MVERAAGADRVAMLQAQLQDGKRAMAQSPSRGGADAGAEYELRGAATLALGVHDSGGARLSFEREAASPSSIGGAARGRPSAAGAARWKPPDVAPVPRNSLGKGQRALADPAIQATLKELLDEW
jgi:hypothetical protein